MTVPGGRSGAVERRARWVGSEGSGAIRTVEESGGGGCCVRGARAALGAAGGGDGDAALGGEWEA